MISDKKLMKIRKACLFGIPAFLTLAIVLAVAGINSLNKNSPVAAVTNTASSNSDSLLQKLPSKCSLNSEMNDLVFTDKDGKKVDIAALRGKPVVLTFFASWCPHCVRELNNYPKFIEMCKQKGAEYLLVDKLDNNKETKDTALQYLTQNNINCQTLFDDGLAVYKALGLKVVPTTLVIDKNGVLRAWSTKELTDSQLESMVDYAISGADSATLGFIENSLTNESGGIKTNFKDEKDSGLKSTDILSESQGLMMLYAAERGNKTLFDKTYSYVKNSMMTNGHISWVIKDNKASSVNSIVDDLRIYRALSVANEKFGGYDSQLSVISASIYSHNVDKGNLVDCYDIKTKTKATTLKLCGADFTALKALSDKNDSFKTIYDKTLETVSKGYISDAFPLYRNTYDYKKKTYDNARINTAEEMVTLYNLAKIGKLPETTKAWLKAAIEEKNLYASYNTDGKVSDGYAYESTAIYAIAAMTAHELGDTNLESKALERMEKLRVFDTASQFNGAFGNSDGSGIYSFDQLTAINAYARFNAGVYHGE